MKEQFKCRLGIATLGPILACLSVVWQSTSEAQVWVPKGPAPATGGGSENVAGGDPVSGAIEALVAHPSDADILWIGSVNGGIWKTNNATSASPGWTPLFDDQAGLSIGALELDPTDASNNTLLAGVGFTSSFARTGASRSGLYRSTNGGTTWSQLSGDLIGANISGVVARGNTIVASLNGADAGLSCNTLGIVRSTDDGNTFTSLNSTSFGTTSAAGLPCGFAWDIASNPNVPSRIYAPATGTAESTDGLYTSNTTGASWSKVSNAAMDLLLQNSPSNVEIVVANSGVVFTGICNNGQLSGLFRSANSGSTWQSLDLPSSTELGTQYGIHPGGQCGVHLSMAIDPNDDNIVYIGGDRQPANNENGNSGPQFPNSIGARAYGGRLYKVDAGKSPGSQATPITNCSASPSLPAGCTSQSTANNSGPHADSRQMVFDANGRLLETDDGGIYAHTNATGTTGDWISLNGNLQVTEAHDSDFDSISNVLITGNQDNGTTNQESFASLNWITQIGGDGGDVAVAANYPSTNQSTRYMSAQNFQNGLRAVFDANNIFQGYVFVSLTPINNSPSPTAQFTTPLAVNSVNPARLLFGGGNGLFESLDQLDSVQRISTATVNTPVFGGGAVMDYGAVGNENALYAATGDQILASVSVALPVAVDPNPDSSANILGVAMKSDDANRAFAVDSSKVYGTENGGGAWNDLSGNLASLSPGRLRTVEFLPVGGGSLLVGADYGVFKADASSGFTSWSEFGSGLPEAMVYELSWNDTTSTLAAGTMGRGVWTVELIECAVDLALGSQTIDSAEIFQASNSIILGPDLIINGSGTKEFESGSTISADGPVSINSSSGTVSFKVVDDPCQ